MAGAVAVLASRYLAVGALTGAIVLPLLIGIAAGHAGIDVAACVIVTALVLWGCRSSIRRLRRGEERQIGGSLRAPFKQTEVGLWAGSACPARPAWAECVAAWRHSGNRGDDRVGSSRDDVACIDAASRGRAKSRG
jgi:hypothetical protein